MAGLAKEYEEARANEPRSSGRWRQSKADIQGINRKEFQLGVLEREVQQNRNLYDMFVEPPEGDQRGRATSQSTVARVVDPATVPSDAYSPRTRRRSSASSTLIALLVAAMLALLLDRLNNTLEFHRRRRAAPGRARARACCRRSRGS